MEGKKGEFSIFYKKLNGVLLKKKAYAFRMIMLISDESINSTFIVRHYDY